MGQSGVLAEIFMHVIPGHGVPIVGMDIVPTARLGSYSIVLPKMSDTVGRAF